MPIKIIAITPPNGIFSITNFFKLSQNIQIKRRLLMKKILPRASQYLPQQMHNQVALVAFSDQHAQCVHTAARNPTIQCQPNGYYRNLTQQLNKKRPLLTPYTIIKILKSTVYLYGHAFSRKKVDYNRGKKMTVCTWPYLQYHTSVKNYLSA